MSKISTETRRELVATIKERYRSAPPPDKQRILDEFVALTGYHRKYAIRVLGSGAPAEVGQASTPPRERIYGEAVGEALGILWEAAGLGHREAAAILDLRLVAGDIVIPSLGRARSAIG